MRSAVSILLISCFLVNIVGYKLFFYYQLSLADSRINARIESLDESDTNLFTVKIPIRLPYHTDWDDFESVEGEMSYKNTTYRYVKRKVQRDTLILLCIEHREKSIIEKTSHDYSQKLNDVLPDSSKKQDIKQAKDDFYQRSEVLQVPVYASQELTPFPHGQGLKTTSYHQQIDRPPSAS
jgi:hypothetical protein